MKNHVQDGPFGSYTIGQCRDCGMPTAFWGLLPDCKEKSKMKISNDFDDEMILVDKQSLEDYLDGIDNFFSAQTYGWEECVSKECLKGRKHLKKMLE